MKKSVMFLIILFGILFFAGFGTSESVTGYASSRLTNVSIFILPSVFAGPNITSWEIEPYDPSVGEQVRLNASAVGTSISGIFANITLPNGSVITRSLQTNYTVEIVGRHDIVFWANDSNGNIGSVGRGYFIAGTISVNVSFNVVDKDSAGISTNLTVFFANTNDEVRAYNFSGSHIGRHSNIQYDLYYEPRLSKNVSIRLNNINLSKDYNGTLMIDISQAEGFLVTYGINSSYSINNATLVLSYANTSYSDEDNLKVYKCSNWNMSGRICNSGWAVVSDAVQNKLTDTFRLTTTGFSAYSIKQESAITEIPSGGGGGGGGVSKPKTANFSVNKELIEVDLLQGEKKTINFDLTNYDTRTLDIELKIEGVDGFAKLSDKKFNLEQGKSKTLSLEFYAPSDAKPLVYFGEILIDSGYGIKRINVILRIREIKSLFALSVDVLPEYKKVYAGENVIAEINVENIGLDKNAELDIAYSIRDITGKKIVESRKEHFVIEKSYSVKKFKGEFRLSDKIEPGTYIVLGEISYNGYTINAYDSFDVIQRVSWLWLANLIMFGIIIAMFIVIIYLLLAKRKKREENKHRCYSESELIRDKKNLKKKLERLESAFDKNRIGNSDYLAARKKISESLNKIEHELNRIKNARARYNEEEKAELAYRKQQLKDEIKRLKSTYKNGIIGREDYLRIKRNLEKKMKYIECDLIEKHSREKRK